MKITKHEIAMVVEGRESYWASVHANYWEPETFEVLGKYLDKDHSYLDIGAWIGPTVLYGAQLAKKVYAFEPDNVARTELLANLALNPNIKNVHVSSDAVSSSTQKAKLGAHGAFGDSMSSLLWSKEAQEVNTISLERIFGLYNIEDCNFIKIDIEGGEAIVLQAGKETLRKFHPTLHLSLHTPWFENKQEYFDKITDALSVYEKLYNIKGERITLDEVRKLEGFTTVLATNL